MRKEGKVAGLVSAVVVAFLAAAATETGRRFGERVVRFVSGNPVSCPAIAGDWNYQTPGGIIPLILSQTECRVSGTYETARRKYTITAEYSEGAFHGKLVKLPKAAGDCRSELPLLIRVNDEQTLTMVATGMDCDGSPADPPGLWVHG
jgi:hypothetical protein